MDPISLAGRFVAGIEAVMKAGARLSWMAAKAQHMPDDNIVWEPDLLRWKPQFSDRGEESDSSAGDSGISWDSPALEEGHPLLLIEAAIIDAVLEAFRSRQNGTGNKQGTEESSANNSFTPTVPTHIGQGSNGKRKLAPCRKDGDESPSAESTQKKARTAPPRLTFACPFYKKDPVRYRTCYRYLLTRIRDVKQHVTRRHKLPIYCASCMDIFTTSTLRDEHTRARTCPTRPFVVFDGVTEEQKQLLARRISSRHCEEDQWYTVFDILFPGHSRPSSPYID
ncbi:hypothetical protein GE09DRAFT_1222092 [Coniochaeta sp. 2T2.1]|nr:hypothetical protein GE09DRAFT_1222092 [Coniochaeta sp. 2T2.1]